MSRRASHSMESALTEAVALLDEAAASALTFRLRELTIDTDHGHDPRNAKDPNPVGFRICHTVEMDPSAVRRPQTSRTVVSISPSCSTARTTSP